MPDTLTPPAAPAATESTPDDWVPADQRVAGFDKRTIVPGLVALALWFIWAHAMPWINEQIEFDNPAVAGDVIDLGGGDLTMVPAVGWQIEDGILVSEDPANPVALGGLTGGHALLSEEGISFQVESADFDGTPDELLDVAVDTSDALDEIQLEDVQDRLDIVNADGVPGRLVPFVAQDENGFIAAFVFEVEAPATSDSGEEAVTPPPVGVQVTVRADINAEDALGADVAAMLQSITYTASTDEEADS